MDSTFARKSAEPPISWVAIPGISGVASAAGSMNVLSQSATAGHVASGRRFPDAGKKLTPNHGVRLRSRGLCASGLVHGISRISQLHVDPLTTGDRDPALKGTPFASQRGGRVNVNRETATGASSRKLY